MTCPKCNERTKVIDSQSEEGCVRRRRVCSRCCYRFFTVEIDEDYYERMAKAKEDKRYVRTAD